MWYTEGLSFAQGRRPAQGSKYGYGRVLRVRTLFQVDKRANDHPGARRPPSTSANDARERSECRYARFGVQVRLNAAAMVLSRAAFESRYLS